MERLNAIFSVIPQCEVLADIGCDHGKLTRKVLLESRARKVIATDISEKCLSKARELNSDLDNVQFCVGDGLQALGENKADVIVISGMGGNTMMDILKSLPNAVLVLQPQSDVPLFRKFLVENGYEIDKDFVICVANKYYDIIRAKKGKMVLDEMQLLYGVFYKEPNQFLKAKLQLIIDKTQKYNQTPKNIQVLNTAKEAIKWQQ